MLTKLLLYQIRDWIIEERTDDNEIDLKSIIDMNKDCQILILEGFKKNNDIPKIEVFLKK